MRIFVWLSILFSFSPVWAQPAPLRKVQVAKVEAIRADLDLILKHAGLPVEAVQFSWNKAKNSRVKVQCSKQGALSVYSLQVDAPAEEWSSAFYYGLQKLGFLFPHPRIQVSPDSRKMAAACGQTYAWQPRFAYRGFHLHTMHPGEWLHGFLMGQKAVGEDTLRWHARNSQNIIQIVLLKKDVKEIARNLEPLIQLSHQLGVNFGVDVSFNLIQQKAYRLIGQDSLMVALGFWPGDRRNELKRSLNELMDELSFDFMTIEIGSSEYTSSGYQKTIDWMNTAEKTLGDRLRSLYIKVHATEGVSDPRFGNFNFLPQYADARVGILPHTVMYYSLTDPSAPVYGRKTFETMAAFLKEQAPKRPTWYYPETSYFIAMDIDVPLFLTDYLLARSQDMDDIEKWGASGQINFSTGQEVGYWLKDWTVALLNTSEYRGNPYIGLELLGESRTVWEPIVNFQHLYVKQKGLLEELSSANLMDEMPFVHFVTHERTVFRELRKQADLLRARIALLKEAIQKIPDISGVKNAELKAILNVTNLRFRHALALREALLLDGQGQRSSEAFRTHLTEATRIRLEALQIMTAVRTQWNRYPEAQVFSQHENWTSYPYGYAWPARTLHFWEREEKMIERNSYWPWVMNIYSLRRILL